MLGTILDFTRVRVTFAVTLTTATGFFLWPGGSPADFLFVVLGVFLLASGSSALNQVQESAIDARMERTRKRPIPSEKIQRGTGLFLAVLMILSGFLFSILLWADLSNGYVWIVLGVTLSFGAIGFYDDYLKVTKRTSSGFSGKVRLLLELFIAGLATYGIMVLAGDDHAGALAVPFFKDVLLYLGPL